MSVLVPCLLSRPDVCGACTPSAPRDVIQTPEGHSLFGPNREGQPGTHPLHNPVPVVHIGRPECADQSADPPLLPPHDFRQALQGRSQVSQSRDLLLAVTTRSIPSTFR